MTSKKNSAASKAARQRVAQKQVKVAPFRVAAPDPASLLGRLTSHLSTCWRNLFKQDRGYDRFAKMLLALLVCPGRKTLTNAFHMLGHTHEGWRADYAIIERAVWKALDLFKPVLLGAVRKLGPDDVIEIPLDDTCLPKTGQKIPDTSWCHDPLAPRWVSKPSKLGIRMLHAGITIRDGQNRPLVVTIGFFNAPPEPKLKVKKGETATKEEVAAFKAREKEKKLTVRAVAFMAWVRKVLDDNGFAHRKIRLIVDGSYANNVVIEGIQDLHDTELIGRFRKSAKVFLPYTGHEKGRHVYGTPLPEPQYYLRDIPTTLLQFAMLHVGGRAREVRFADIPGILWQGTKGRLMRMILVKPLPYLAVGQGIKREDKAQAAPAADGEVKIPRRRRKFYNEPSYLITTDHETPAAVLAQGYFFRWQIEELHREMKTDLGIGQVQAYSDALNSRIHSAQAAGYALLNLASLDCPTGKYGDGRPELPGWRRLPPMRITCHELITSLRNDIQRINFFHDPNVAPVLLPKDFILTARETYQVA